MKKTTTILKLFGYCIENSCSEIQFNIYDKKYVEKWNEENHKKDPDSTDTYMYPVSFTFDMLTSVGAYDVIDFITALYNGDYDINLQRVEIEVYSKIGETEDAWFECWLPDLLSTLNKMNKKVKKIREDEKDN